MILRSGSSGNDVLDLQTKLKGLGYTIDTDGQYGSQTAGVVKQFQQDYGLDVDGEAGNQTFTKLNELTSNAGATGGSQTEAPQATQQLAKQTTTPAATTTPAQTEAPKFEYTPYTPSETVAQAEALLQQQLANKPGEYKSTWEGELKDTIAQILNREKFSYDLNGDALYQQYKDQYVNQGKLAMMDTMGQAAAMTGGYGNSYAQTVGQQAYQVYLQQLNDKIPELYQLALNQYNTEGQALYDQASLLAGMEEQEYSRYMDQLTNYYTELGMAQDEARYQAEQDYNRWADGINLSYEQFINDRAYDYQAGRDAVADQQWQAQFDEAKRQYDEQMALTESKSSSSSPSSNSTERGSYTANPGWDKEKIEAFQDAHGLTVDGIWGPQTANAYDNDPNWDGANPDYSDWTAGEWEGYFAAIRQSDGKDAAQEELKYFTSNGLIPKNMVTYATIGARGGQMGH
jgi:peptidoglycan hydrolase-like protein with peptidoglycan-binding domain